MSDREKEQIEHYMKHFYGYGSWDGDYWFVGLEEGVGKSARRDQAKKKDTVTEAIIVFNEKVQNFNRLCPMKTVEGNYDLLDNCLFQWELYPDYFNLLTKQGKPQPTHKPFIQLLKFLNTDKKVLPSADDDEIKELQAKEFGRDTCEILGSHCVIELLPFPSPMRNQTEILNKYKDELISIFDPEHKKNITKATYRKWCLYENPTARIDFLKKKLNSKKHYPKLVIFYDPERIDDISELVGINNEDWKALEMEAHKNQIGSKTKGQRTTRKIIPFLLCHCNEKTLFVITEHPARGGYGKKATYWKNACETIKELLDTKTTDECK